MADDIASNVVGTMLEPIRDSLYAFISRQFGYLVHYKKNIKDFENEVDKLKDAMERIQARVKEAENNAEVIEKNVSKWLDEVQSTLRTMEEVRNRLLQNAENLQCLDVSLRYRLGKEGKKKKPVVTKLIEDGNNFGTVGHRPPLTRTWLRTHTINYESFESRELVFNDIMEALKDDRNYKIGIYGMPGVGKTRMMEEVAKQAKEDKLFDQIAKTVVSENPNLEKIQKQLAEALGLTLDKDTEGARMELLHNRLKNGERILLMVDDLWNDRIKLEDIGIPATSEHTKGCKILLTSRRRDVCEAMEVAMKENFQIGVLSKAEAWSLFKKKVGDSIESHEMHSIAEAVCEECAGLPLAILAVGGALKSKSKQVWEDALKQLKSSTAENIAGLPAKLYSPIELSYNHLEPIDAKSLFLFLCLFPEDTEIRIDWLVRFGFGMSLLRGVDTIKEARNRIHALVDTLKTSSLLLQGDEEHLVKMHDVIRDVAISIASKDKDVMFLVKTGIEKWSEKDEYKRYRAISLWFNDDCVIPNDLEFPDLRTLILGLENLSEVPHSFFNGMEKLEVLFVEDACIQSLPSSLKNLRMLLLISCELMNLAYLKEFKKLEILSIEDFALKELAPEIGQLSLLRLLDLRDCYNLKIIPAGVISSLSQLEELYIPDKFDQWGVKDNANLKELNSLTSLISLQVHVPNVELLPLNELRFKSLIRFQISIGRSFKDNEIRSSATRILKLGDMPLKRELNILMEKAEVLCLVQLKGLKDVFHDRYGEGFQELEYLQVEDCDEMEHLLGKPKWINLQSNQLCASGSFSKLRELQVVNCQLMKYLFSAATARGLPQLQRLHICNCRILEEIVGDIEQEVMDTITFHQLKKMELECLPNLRSFYGNTKKMSTRGCNGSTLAQALFNDKVAFPALEKLNIKELESLSAIWDDQLQSLLVKEARDSFRQLMYLNVFKCEKLVNVIPSNMLPRLQNLEKLEVSNCDLVLYEVEVVGTVEKGYPRATTPTINVLPRLQEMYLYSLPSLVMYIRLNRLCACSNLTDLHLSNCDSLGNVFSPSTVRYVVHLKTLYVANCKKMEEIVAVERGQLGEEDVVPDDDIIVFPQLKHLRLWNLPNLKSFCFCTRGSKKQEEEIVEQKIISRVEALFNHKVAFPALDMLEIYGLGSVTAIWDDPLQSVLLQLQELDIRHCEILEEIIGDDKEVMMDIVSFHRLKKIKLHRLPNLRSFYVNLKKTSTTRCNTSSLMQVLFNHKVRFPALEELEIYDLKSITKIWDNELFLSSKGEDSFRKLRNINVRRCHKLVNVVPPNALPLLQGLEILEVGECYSVVCGVEMVAPEEGSDEIIVFSRLKTIRLKFLPNLKSFCLPRSGGEDRVLEGINILLQQQTLFNHQVRFPALKELEIYDLKSITTIWDNELFLSSKGEDSFRKLRNINVRKCHKLVNVVPPNALPLLQGLEILEVGECYSVVCGVEMVAPEEGSDEILVFSRLKTIRLKFLPNLKSFCLPRSGGEDRVLEGNNILLQQQTLFNHQVAFPALDMLEIYGLGSVTAIWDDPLQSVLLQLQELDIRHCEILEEIIGDDKEVMMDIVSFHRLKKIKLHRLPNLRSFYVNLKKTSTTRCNSSSLMQVLFNHKVRFPALEELEIYDLKSITKIWDNELFLSSKGENSFRKLRNINVRRCHKLVNVVPSNALPLLQGLEILEVRECYSVVCGVEMVAPEECSDEILVFSRLKTIRLKFLPNLKSFCLPRSGGEDRVLEGNNILLQQQTLFNHQVRFLALKELEIYDLKSITTIWDNELFLSSKGEDSFRMLRNINVRKCHKLVNVVPPNALPLLQGLEILEVGECYSVVCGVEMVAPEEGSDEILVFSRLKTIRLKFLPNLKSFCLPRSGGEDRVLEGNNILLQQQTLFNHQVAFPALDMLEIYGLGSVTAIWDDPLQSVLLQLQELDIRHCEILEEIIGDDKEVMMDIVSFHRLKKIKLHRLPNLRSFYVNLKKTSTTRCNTSSLMQVLFNHKVRFPALEELEIYDLKSITKIWDNKLFLSSKGEDSFRKLRNINVRRCHKLVNVVPPNALPLLRGLKILEVGECYSVVCGVEMVAPEEGSDEILVFSRLKTIRLKFLPNLKSFCLPRSGGEDRVLEGNNILLQQQTLFNHQVRFPALKELEIYDLKSITTIWDNELFLSSKGEDSFRKLRNINVRKCHKLVNVVPPNALPLLQGLEILEVGECYSVVCGVEMVAPEEGSDEILVFSRLKTIRLKFLPNLKSFCLPRSGGEDRVLEGNNILLQQQTLFNHQVAFPALDMLEIYGLGSVTAIWDDPLQSVLLQLQELDIRHCEILEEIIGDDKEVMMDIVSFHRLKKIKLHRLPNLRSFYVNLKKTSTTRCNSSSLMQVLFNHKVRFPALEELEIYDLKSITTIWDNELFLSSKGEESFRKLRNINVRKCHKLVNVVPPNALPLLQGLEILELGECYSVVCGVEMVAPEEGSDEILVFSRLKTIRLKFLPNLKSFCLPRSGGEDRVLEGNNILLQQQTLFNHQVWFPALEELEIYDLKSITTIWDNELFLSSKGEESFRKLRNINVRKCHKLVNVVPPNALPLLQGLEILEVGECYSVVCGVEMVAPEEGSDEILVFSRLKTIRLKFLPNLKCFCLPRSGGEDRVLEGNNILLQQQTLFNHQVRLPALEELEIYDLKSITTIWDNELFLSSKGEDSFRKLRNINVQKCHKLLNVVPPNALPLFHGLEILEVGECCSVVCGVEMAALEEGSDEILVFSRLKTMRLKFLPNLKSFCLPRSGREDRVLEGNSNLLQQQTLFNHQVRFPALEELEIYDLKSITTIWDNELFLSSKGEDSFRKLRNINVRKCHKLVNVVPPNALPLLQGLEILEVGECYSVVCGVEMVAPKEGSDEILVFSRLKTIRLKFLPNLKSFCLPRSGGEDRVLEGNNILLQQQTLFNHQVRFPALEELEIEGLKSLTAIWDNQSFLGSGAQNSFQQLRLVNVKGCEELVRVLEESNIPQPQTLFNHKVKFASSLTMKVDWCPKLEMFPCLYLNTVELKIFDAPLQPFRKEKVELPILEKLLLGDGSIVEGTWHGHPASTGAFCKVRLLEVKNCSNLVNASTLLQWYEVVEELAVKSCFSLEVVFKLEELDAIERKAIVSSQIKNLRLFCLPKLVHIWIMEPQGLLVFHNLTSLTVEACYSLRYLLPFSIASLLTQLRVIVVAKCSVIEEIVRSEGQGEEDAEGDIVFSQLVSLKLLHLPKLTSFCWANSAFKFPALEEVSLVRCPEVQTFTSGGISTPPDIKVTGDGGLLRHVSDLNSYVQQYCQYIRKGKGLAMADDEETSD